MDKPQQMNPRGDGPTRSDSDQIAHHAGHNIRSRDPLPEEPPRTVPGNAWCYDCHVPIKGTWSVNYGIRKIGEEPK